MQNNINLWKTLSNAHLVEGEEPTLELESPWYIKLLLSISGWVGAFFLTITAGGTLALTLGLTLGLTLENSSFILFAIGGGVIYLVHQLFQEKINTFMEHFLLSFSISGQVLVIVSIALMFDDYTSKGIYLFVAIFQAFLMWIIPNYIHRMMSSFFMSLALSYLFYTMNIPSLYLAILTFIVAWLWMNEFYFEELKKIQAIAYGQLGALILLKSSAVYAYDILNFSHSSNYAFPLQFSPFLIETISTLTLAFVVWKILEQNNKLNDKDFVLLSLMAVLILGALSLKVSGLVTGVMLLLVGFSSSHRLLMGLGVVSTLFFISNYYYFMGETLLDKAIILALVGVVLLSVRWLVKKFMFKEASYA